MLRKDLIAGVFDVAELLERANVLQALINSTRGGKEGTAVIVGTLQALSRAEPSLSPAALEVIQIFGLADIFSTELWQRIISEDVERSRERTIELRYAVRAAISQLPSVVSLLLRSSDQVEQSAVGDEGGASSGESKLTLILPEGQSQSSPRRLILALESIEGFYHVICTLRGANPDTLAIAACDSGSDKMFDFTGLDGVMRELKETLLGVWDRIVLHGRNRTSASLDNIAKALPILDEIEERKLSGVLGAEDAEILKRKVFHSVAGVQSSGAVLKEADDRLSSINVKQLAAPSPKLLAAPVQDDYSDDEKERARHAEPLEEDRDFDPQ